MTGITDYPKEFVQRTLELLDEGYLFFRQRNLEVTFLLNCLLGLIVATSENIRKCESGFFKRRLTNNEIVGSVPRKIKYVSESKMGQYINKQKKENQSFSYNSNEEKNTEINLFETGNDIALITVIDKIRNGVAHQNIKPINKNGRWSGILIWNINKYGIRDFEVEFDIYELETFARFVASKYLSE